MSGTWPQRVRYLCPVGGIAPRNEKDSIKSGVACWGPFGPRRRREGSHQRPRPGGRRENRDSTEGHSGTMLGDREELHAGGGRLQSTERGGRRGHNEQLRHAELGANRDLHPSLPNMFGMFSGKTGTINALYLNHRNPVLASHGIGFGWKAGGRIAGRFDGQHPIVCPTLCLRRIWSLR